MYDVFISYRRNGGTDFTRLLYEHLSRMGLDVFFDIEELKNGMFNTKLYECIEQSHNFLLVLSKNALDRCSDEGDWVKKEILHALEQKKNIVPVMLPDFNWPESLPADIDELRHYNAVKFSEYYFDASIDKLIGMLANVEAAGAEKPDDKLPERTENKYYDLVGGSAELKRIQTQQKIMKLFDEDVYAKVIDRYAKLVVLDVGSNRGDLIADRMGGSERLERIVGLEFDGDLVKKANEKYSGTGKMSFHQIDVEADEMEFALEEIMEQCGVEKFNIIHISLLILHLKNPYKLLKTLRKFLTEDGIVFIKDVDDGINFAYPDENNDFKRAMSICGRLETSGFRESGRQIYNLLKRTGYRKVTLEKDGINTSEMDYDERSAMFDMYFSFILEDLKILTKKYPDNKQMKKDLDWFSDIYEELESRFHDPGFLFSLGCMIYIAQK